MSTETETRLQAALSKRTEQEARARADRQAKLEEAQRAQQRASDLRAEFTRAKTTLIHEAANAVNRTISSGGFTLIAVPPAVHVTNALAQPINYVVRNLAGTTEKTPLTIMLQADGAVHITARVGGFPERTIPMTDLTQDVAEQVLASYVEAVLPLFPVQP